MHHSSHTPRKRPVALAVAAIAATALLAGCEMMPPRAPGSGPAPVGSVQPGTTAPEPGSAEAVSALMQLEDIQSELRSLRNEIELQRRDLDNLQRRQREMYDDLDQRVSAQERGEAPPLADAGQQPMPTDAGDSPLVLGEAPAAAAPSAPQAPSAVDAAGAQRDYDQAFDMLRQGRYADAVEAFRAFQRNHPGSDLADDAQYWVAEAQYVTREFDAALADFRRLVSDYPDSDRVPDALLKVGYIQDELGNREEAVTTLEQVVERYPGSRVASAAQTRLQRIAADN